MESLPEPEVVSCFFHTGFEPHLAAMRLRWPAGPWQAEDARWLLPEGLTFTGAAPEQFGFHVRRGAIDAYAVALLWNLTGITWLRLPRQDLIASSLLPLLSAMGTDLHYLLNQPIQEAHAARSRCA
ncbi:hypothetical protein AYO44_13125 [Planctomycetaceae bacterium SCGC AG-212-F19]|nr:hypothetical protein AYO44_13125 [Planctomycetaceae bacterium SCGC AG-212-F19]